MNKKIRSIRRPAFWSRLSLNTRILVVLIAILLFLAAAVSVSIATFLKADRLSAQAEVLDRVVRETDSLAEVLKASDGSTDAAAELLQEHRGLETSEDLMTLYYTAGFEPSSKSDYEYRVAVQLTPGKTGGCDTWKISWFRATGKKAFYDISFRSIAQ